MRNDLSNRLKALALTGQKGVAWLIDPDDVISTEKFKSQLSTVEHLHLDFIFLGGSLIQENTVSMIIKNIKEALPEIPIILFPGNVIQFSPLADGILFLSLISGRNPDLLIGQHVSIAPLLEKSNLEILPTGYMLVDGGHTTSVHYISQTIPLPNHHPELSVATALAGSYLGLQYFYLDAGSGAPNPVSPEIIKAVKSKVKAPLIVGGGLNSLEKIKMAYQAGADLVVIGNGAEKSPTLLSEVSAFLNTIKISVN